MSSSFVTITVDLFKKSVHEPALAPFRVLPFSQARRQYLTLFGLGPRVKVILLRREVSLNLKFKNQLKDA
jgi:hypothetical protein